MRITRIIAAKEIKEIIRNKYTIIIMLIPFLVYPLLSVGLSKINASSSSMAKIAVVSDNGYANRILDDYFKQSKNISLVDLGKNNEEAIKTNLEDGKIDFAIKISNNSLNFIYSSFSYKSLLSATKFGENFSAFYSSIYKTEHKDYLTMNILDEKGRALSASNSVSNLIMPILMISLIFQSTAGFANDMFAGEKERKTFESLLLSVKPRRKLLFGKALALSAISIILLAVNIISFIMSQMFFEKSSYFTETLMSIPAMIILLSILLILSALSVALSLAVSVFSQNIKNSQMLNEVLLGFLTLLLAMVTFGYFPKAVPVEYIPFIGLFSTFNSVINQSFIIPDFIISVFSTIMLIVLILLLSIRRLKSEKIITK